MGSHTRYNLEYTRALARARYFSLARNHAPCVFFSSARVRVWRARSRFLALFSSYLYLRWGPVWGEGGYIRLARTSDEGARCGVDVTPVDGVGCSGGPPNATVCGTCGILYDASYPTGSFLA